MENSEDEAKIEEKVNIVDDPLLPQKSLFRVDEVASYFDVTDRCIRLWIEHGHLEAKKIIGVIRITRDSILSAPKNIASKLKKA